MAKDDGLYGSGNYGAVQNEQYCMPSWEKTNVDQMSNAMGYHDMSDLANTPKPPNGLQGAKRNVQLDPIMPNARSNDRKGKAF